MLFYSALFNHALCFRKEKFKLTTRTCCLWSTISLLFAICQKYNQIKWFKFWYLIVSICRNGNCKCYISSIILYKSQFWHQRIFKYLLQCTSRFCLEISHTGPHHIWAISEVRTPRLLISMYETNLELRWTNKIFKAWRL